jgi:hypothetical protein
MKFKLALKRKSIIKLFKMSLDKSEIINVHTCADNCCVFKITPYKQVKWNQGDGWKPSSNRVTKAGSFIIDASTSKILLVQSRGQMWGPPKGTMQDKKQEESNDVYNQVAGYIAAIRKQKMEILNGKS